MRFRTVSFKPLTLLGVGALLALLAAGCGPNLLHVGYTPSNKVWYHWVHSADEHTIVVCDIQPDGSETNCVESEM
ncbi:MAG: hypothetical protein JNL21_18825 [Myxococcales bacterium]|nr:hypothetical protein [Myxococcales bacterium]